MTSTRTPDDQGMAAEYALRLLGGDELAEAERRISTDGQFAAEVARWRGRLAALDDETEPLNPPAGLWQRVATAIGLSAPANDNVALLERRLTRWRMIGGGMTALAASLALVLAFEPRTAQLEQPPASQPGASPMIAMLGDGRDSKVMASWDPNARQLVLAVAADMPSDPAHSHELWVIPASGKPRSIGIMPATKQMHMKLAGALATLLQQGATIAISVEPAGGSKTGAPTGPVVASGALRTA